MFVTLTFLMARPPRTTRSPIERVGFQLAAANGYARALRRERVEPVPVT